MISKSHDSAIYTRQWKHCKKKISYEMKYMEQIKDYRIEQCLNDIQKYEKWGNLLVGQSWVHLFNSSAPVSMSATHNGLECIKAKMKLNVLQDNTHTDEAKEKRLNQIDLETHQMEEIMKHDLEYRGLLIP
ncbi:MAG: hypothetical protein J6Y78_03880 [Paludibacteraceae bacterium]|nr:hypothetical protein [Paludibacteraceae bacterium]